MEDWEKELVPAFPAATAEPEDWEKDLEPAVPAQAQAQAPVPATAPKPPGQTEQISGLEAAGIGLRSGLTKGWDARFGAWLQEKAQGAANALPKGSLEWAGVDNRYEQDPEQVGEDARQGNWMEYDTAVEQHPKTVGLTELAGDVTSDLVTHFATGGATANPLGNALLGGIEGAGRSRGGATEMASGAATGAALGGLFGVGGKYVAKIVPGGASVANPLVNAAGAGLGEGIGSLTGETDAEKTKRRTQAAAGLGLTLPGALRKLASMPFAKRADKAVGEVREGLVNEDHRAAQDVDKAFESGQATRSKALADTERASDDVAYANMDKLARSLKDRQKGLNSALETEGKKMIRSEEESNKALVSAWMKEEAAKRVKASMDAGEDPDPQDLRDLGPEGDLHARALGILGNKVQEAFRYLRSQQGLEPHGFALTPKAQEGVKATVPDYAAKGNKQLEDLAGGKAAMLEQIKAELAAQAPGPKRASKAEADSEPPEFDDVVQAQNPRDLYDATPDVDPKTKVPADVQAKLREQFRTEDPNVVDVPLEHLPVKPAPGIDAPKFPGVDPTAAEPFDARVAQQLDFGKERVKNAAWQGAKTAWRNPAALATGGGGFYVGALLGGPAGAATGLAAGPAIGAYGAMSRRSDINPNTLKFKFPNDAAVFYRGLTNAINGNEALRNRLGNFLNVQSADILAQRIQWLLQNDPEVAALADTPAP